LPYDEDLTNLDDWLRRLKVEYTIYFNGHRKRPPDDLRMRVEKVVKRLSETGDMSYSERFRYNTLVTRFYVLRDLWRRTMAGRELAQEPKPGPAPDATSPQNSVSSGTKVVIHNPESEEDKVRTLYQALVDITLKKSGHNPPVSYEQFLKYISTQTKNLQQKFGCSAVAFNLALDKDAVKFTARAEDVHLP
jgi:hypothetical protein